MAISLNYEFLFVGRDEESFLENYAYDISEEDENRDGHLFVSVEVQNNPADAEKIGDIIFDGIRRTYFETSSFDDSYDRFEEALKDVNKKLKKLKSEKVSGYIGNMNVLIAVFHNGILHLTQTGDAEAYLIRRRFVSSVSEGLSDGGDSSDDIFTNIASGTVEEGDVIVFSSTRLLRYMTKNDLARSAGTKDPVAVLADLKDLISTEILGKVGLAAITFTKSESIVGPDLPQLDDLSSDSEEQIDMQEDFAESKPTKSRRSLKLSFTVLKDVGANAKDWIHGLKRGGMTKQRILIMLIAVILLLTVGIWYAKKQAQTRDEILALDDQLNQVQEAIDTAQRQGQYDKEAAAVTLSRAEELATEVASTGYYRPKANQLLQSIQDTRDSLDNVNRISNPKVYADLTTKRDTVSALGLLPGKDGHLFVFEESALYELILNELQDPLTLDDTELVIAGTYFDDRDSEIFLTKSGKLLEYKDGTINFMDTQDSAFHRSVSLDDWGNRVYLLDSENNQIWRYSYSGARDQFSIGEAYNTDGDVKGGTDIVIDGSIYVLKADGTVTRLYAGSNVDFPVKKQPFSTPSTASRIWTDDETSQLFILDSSSSKVYVYLKDAQKSELVYSHQYLFDTLGELRDFYINKEDNRMYLLDATKVYEVEL